MKTRKLISALLSALLLCSAAVVLFSAADTAAVQKSREENSGLFKNHLKNHHMNGILFKNMCIM